MIRSTAQQRARLAGCVALLAVVVLNGPHEVACRSIDSGQPRYIYFGLSAIGWPSAFRGHIDEMFHLQIKDRTGKRFLAFNYYPVRPWWFLFDLAFACCLIAAAVELSKRAQTRFSLLTLLALLTVCACLMGVTVRWDYRTAATVLAVIIILAGGVMRARRGFRRGRSNSTREITNAAPTPVDPLRQAAL